MTDQRAALWQILQDPKSFGIKKSERAYSVVDYLFYEGVAWVGSKSASRDYSWLRKLKKLLKEKGVSVKMENDAPKGGRIGKDLVLTDSPSLHEIEDSKSALFRDYIEHLFLHTKEEVSTCIDIHAGDIYYASIQKIMKMDRIQEHCLFTKYTGIVYSKGSELKKIESAIELASEFTFPAEIPSVIAINHYYFRVYLLQYQPYQGNCSAGLRPGIYNFKQETLNPIPHNWIVYYRKEEDPDSYLKIFGLKIKIELGKCYYKADFTNLFLYKVIGISDDDKVKVQTVKIFGSSFTTTSIHLILNEELKFDNDIQTFENTEFEEILHFVEILMHNLFAYYDKDVESLIIPSQQYTPKHPKGQCYCYKQGNKLMFLRTLSSYKYDQISADEFCLYKDENHTSVSMNVVRGLRINEDYKEIDRKAFSKIWNGAKVIYEPAITKLVNLQRNLYLKVLNNKINALKEEINK